MYLCIYHLSFISFHIYDTKEKNCLEGQRDEQKGEKGKWKIQGMRGEMCST